MDCENAAIRIGSGPDGGSEHDLLLRVTERAKAVRPDYIVIVEYMSPTVLEWLRAPASGYSEVAAFAYRSPVRSELVMPMLDPKVWIFQRDSSSASRPASVRLD